MFVLERTLNIHPAAAVNVVYGPVFDQKINRCVFRVGRKAFLAGVMPLATSTLSSLPNRSFKVRPKRF